MKTGECVKLINPEAGDSDGSVDWITIWKVGKGKYKLVIERNSRMRSKEIGSSAEVRKIVKLAESSGYKMVKKGVELDA